MIELYHLDPSLFTKIVDKRYIDYLNKNNISTATYRVEYPDTYDYDFIHNVLTINVEEHFKPKVYFDNIEFRTNKNVIGLVKKLGTIKSYSEYDRYKNQEQFGLNENFDECLKIINIPIPKSRLKIIDNEMGSEFVVEKHRIWK